MAKTSIRTAILALLITLGATAHAQCGMRNTAFKAGENLSYNLYFNWNFLWYKVGTASLSINDTRYKGQEAYKCRLVTKSNEKLDKHFIMRDTLVSCITKDLLPLYYRKGSKEGKRYTVDEVWYSYNGNNSKIKMRRLNNDKTVSHNEVNSQRCVFDMLSLFLRSRSLNVEGWSNGHKENAEVASGRDISKGQLILKGKETVKADNGQRYRCLRLEYSEWNNKKKKFEKLATFFVTDDNNHIPVRLDFSLRFGSAKAYLTSMKGNKK